MTSYSQYTPAYTVETSYQPQAYTSAAPYVVQQQQPGQYVSAQPATQSVVYNTSAAPQVQYVQQPLTAQYQPSTQYSYVQQPATTQVSYVQQPAAQISYVQQPATTQVSYVQQPQYVTPAPATSTALVALDAADGKIDGKYFGHQLVPAAASAVRSTTPRRLTELERYEAMKELATRQRVAQQTQERERILQQQAMRVMTGGGSNTNKRRSNSAPKARKGSDRGRARRGSERQHAPRPQQPIYVAQPTGTAVAYPPAGYVVQQQPQVVQYYAS